MDKKKPIIFLDFDGTLIDTSKRHYKVYREIVDQLNGKPLSRSVYWKLKRDHIEWPDILKKSLIQPNKFSLFSKKFISKIELEENLVSDSIFHHTHEVLGVLYNNYTLYLTSLRHSRIKVIKQLNNLGLKKYFKRIIISPNREKMIASINRVIQITKDYSKMQNVIVGDTEDQIIIGKKLGLISIVLLSGIRNKQILIKYHPNFIAKNVSFLPKLLTKV